MAEVLGKKTKKEAMKEILRKLHSNEISPAQAKERFLNEIGDINSVEVAEIEQSLIEEGVSVDLIKNFCNIHASIFESTLKDAVKDKSNPNHPVQIFKKENRKIEELCNEIEKLLTSNDPAAFKEKMKPLLNKLKEIEIHYEKKEQLLFPYLEKKNFTGPSKVMWGKHNDIRKLLRDAESQIETVDNSNIAEYIDGIIKPLLEEVKSMIVKEENILFPTALEKLDQKEWIDILKGSADIGFCLIDGPEEIKFIAKEYKTVLSNNDIYSKLKKSIDGDIKLPTGSFSVKELEAVFNTLPIDITFIDANDEVKYFSDNKTRVFTRTKAIIGRKVQNCHPPKSLDAVEKILRSFKDGSRDSYDFWLKIGEKFVYIRYFAVRDSEGNYLGTLEVTQDISNIKTLEGEKRLLDEN